MKYTYEYPKADVTVDIVVFGLDLKAKKLLVLLIRRGGEPYRNCWAIPGGFIHMDERLGDSAARELKEETGVELSYIEQLYTFGRPDRDPRGRVITVAYMGLVRPEMVTPVGADDATEARWFPVDDVGVLALAFDHAEILDMALRRLRGKLRWQPVGVDLLPDYFTLGDLQMVYEIILGRPLDKRNFRRRVLSFGVMTGGQFDPVIKEEAGTTTGRTRHYRFDKGAYDRLRREGLDFEV
jgi:8-oxo-dGTP diphosphatase